MAKLNPYLSLAQCRVPATELELRHDAAGDSLERAYAPRSVSSQKSGTPVNATIYVGIHESSFGFSCDCALICKAARGSLKMSRSKVINPELPRRRGRQSAVPAASSLRFPMRELNSWLRCNLSWDHADWLLLMEELKSCGFQHWTDSDTGQDAIGLYLESKRQGLLPLFSEPVMTTSKE
jgi:hypothetical protein